MEAAALPTLTIWSCPLTRHRATRLDLRLDLLTEAAEIFGKGYHADHLRDLIAGDVGQKIARDILAAARSAAWQNYCSASTVPGRARWLRAEAILAELQRAEPIEVRPAPAHVPCRDY